MQSTKCWAPPSRRSSRSTLVTTTYFRPMSATVRARFSGSPASGGFGRPWATSQNEQRRVQTSPRIMKVAVPWLKHSWMFGQLASSHTVTRRFSRSLALSCGHRVAATGCARGSTTACAAPARRRTAPASARSCRRRAASRPAAAARRRRRRRRRRAGWSWRRSRSWRRTQAGERSGAIGRCGQVGAPIRRRRPNWAARCSQQHRLDRVQAGRAAQV